MKFSGFFALLHFCKNASQILKIALEHFRENREPVFPKMRQHKNNNNFCFIFSNIFRFDGNMKPGRIMQKSKSSDHGF